MAGRRNNSVIGGQNNQFFEGLTTLLQEHNRIHGEQIQQLLQAREQEGTPRHPTPSAHPLTDADKVRCAVYMLRDDARVWWEGARLTVDLATLTWADFKKVFYGKYFTADNRTRLAREFLELRQGDMTVAEYVRRFERGRYFVLMIASQPVEELKHFIEGLRAAIRHDVRLSRVTTFREAVDQALIQPRRHFLASTDTPCHEDPTAGADRVPPCSATSPSLTPVEHYRLHPTRVVLW
ncbi:hypothetical protein ZIOFF_024414 [Zingiber officinale]|uniref:Retrotransposon gag domain-containing protein n=1 Tax=Zingiber officinale TaxID=94328 RepID=A0A8J5GU82_ZINOF|nr:hypothetical protein ZIOFF_024414 [Zingiber officinale]